MGIPAPAGGGGGAGTGTPGQPYCIGTAQY